MEVILFCPKLFKKSLSGAILQNDHHLLDYSYDTLPDIHLFRKIIGKIGLLYELYSFLSFNSKLNQFLVNWQPTNDQVVLVVHGHFLSKRNKILLRRIKPYNLILWTTDSVSRHKSQSGLFRYSNRIYLHDGGEADNQNKTWLPFGFDDEIFFPRDINKDIDVLFIGNIYSSKYSSRLKYLLTLENSELPVMYNCVYAGKIRGIFQLLKSCNKITKFKRTGRVSQEKLAELINRSRICINIHQDDGRMPVNPMFFAIPATGSCMLTDHHEYFSEWLKSGEDFIPVKNNNVISIINSLLESNSVTTDSLRFSRALSARNYSLASGIKRIIDDIKNSVI